MQDDEKGSPISVRLRRFIHYVKRGIKYDAEDFDKMLYRRYANEFLPDDGDLSIAPSMQERLENWSMVEATPFMRSDGKGEPLMIQHSDLADALDALTPKERDFLIKVFQEGMPIAIYAVEEGISRSMAYRRQGALLEKLKKSITRKDDGK